MAIVKMKKLRLAVMSRERKALLRDLLLLGCVEFSEPSELESKDFPGLSRCSNGELNSDRADYALLTDAIKLMDRYAPVKGGFLKPLPTAKADAVLDESQLQADLAMAEKITGKAEEIRRAQSETSRLESTITSLEPWLGLDMPLNFKGTERTVFATAAMPATASSVDADTDLAAAAPESQLFPVSEDKTLKYMVLICYKDELNAALEALRPRGFNLMSPGDFSGTAREETKKAQDKIKELAELQQKLAGEIAVLASHRDELKLRADTIMTKIARAEAEGRLMSTESTVFLQGWVPAEKVDDLGRVLGKYDCAWETADPTPDETADVPIKLKNNRITAPYSMITEMYSLPAYNGIDPNPFIMPAFALFFGIMFADMAYGLIMILAGATVLIKARPKGGTKQLMSLLVQCGITTFIVGFLTGSFFGDSVSVVGSIFGKEWTLIPVFTTIHIGDSIAIDLPLNLLEGNNPLYMLIFAMCLGLVHLAVGVGLNVYLNIKDHNWLDVAADLSWWIIFAGIAVMVLGGGNIVLYVGIAIMVISAFLKGKGFGRITSIFSAIYNGVTGYLGDILSYSRLMALMLAGSVIASVFNQLGSLGGIILFIPVFLIGHTLNFGLNIIGCFVHTMRLQFLEFFGKWYRDGGRPFRPLKIETKFVDIKED